MSHVKRLMAAGIVGIASACADNTEPQPLPKPANEMATKQVSEVFQNYAASLFTDFKSSRRLNPTAVNAAIKEVQAASKDGKEVVEFSGDKKLAITVNPTLGTLTVSAVERGTDGAIRPGGAILVTRHGLPEHSGTPQRVNTTSTLAQQSPAR